MSGGATLALIFLIIIPEVNEISDSVWIPLLMLVGFSTFYLTEKWLYQHVKSRRRLTKDLRKLHTLGFFIDHFLLGFILVNIISLDRIPGIIVIIPLIMHTLATSVYMVHIHEKVRGGNKLLLSGSTLFGVIIALTIEIEANVQAYTLAFIVGVLLFVVSRDVLPRKQKGRPAMFVVGSTVVTAVWFVLTFMV